MKCPHCGALIIKAPRLPNAFDSPQARKERWATKILHDHRHEATYPAVLEGLAGQRGEDGRIFAWEMIGLWDRQASIGRAPKRYPWEKRANPGQSSTK